MMLYVLLPFKELRNRINECRNSIVDECSRVTSSFIYIFSIYYIFQELKETVKEEPE